MLMHPDLDAGSVIFVSGVGYLYYYMVLGPPVALAMQSFWLPVRF